VVHEREREFTKERERKCVGVCEILGENESQKQKESKEIANETKKKTTTDVCGFAHSVVHTQP
jgi:hypothetical protein